MPSLWRRSTNEEVSLFWNLSYLFLGGRGLFYFVIFYFIFYFVYFFVFIFPIVNLKAYSKTTLILSMGVTLGLDNTPFTSYFIIIQFLNPSSSSSSSSFLSFFLLFSPFFFLSFFSFSYSFLFFLFNAPTLTAELWSSFTASSCSTSETSIKAFLSTIFERSDTRETCLETYPDNFLNSG